MFYHSTCPPSPFLVTKSHYGLNTFNFIHPQNHIAKKFIEQISEFKIISHVFKALHNLALIYLSYQNFPYTHSHTLHSSPNYSLFFYTHLMFYLLLPLLRCPNSTTYTYSNSLSPKPLNLNANPNFKETIWLNFFPEYK